MKWETDWLYQTILREIENIWKRAQKDGIGPQGPAPDYLLVSQLAGLTISKDERNPSRLSAFMVAPAIKQWVFDESGIRPITESEAQSENNYLRRGMFYQVGTVDFYISPERKLVVLRFQVGPLYAAQRVFKVRGQGKRGENRGRLEMHTNFVWWIS